MLQDICHLSQWHNDENEKQKKKRKDTGMTEETKVPEINDRKVYFALRV